MHSDAYLQITFPGMSDWKVEEIHSNDNTIIGYQIIRTQIAAVHMCGIGNEDNLDNILHAFEERSRTLNAKVDPLIIPTIS